MAFAVAAGRQPKFPTHQPITKSMYFRPRESVRMLPLVAATCSSAGSSLASGSPRPAGMNDPFRARDGDRVIIRDRRVRSDAEHRLHHLPATLEFIKEIRHPGSRRGCL